MSLTKIWVGHKNLKKPLNYILSKTVLWLLMEPEFRLFKKNVRATVASIKSCFTANLIIRHLVQFWLHREVPT